MRAVVGGIELEYETRGPADGEPIVLVCGIYQQLSFWPDEFLDALAAAGLRVVVFDNRDIGHSTRETRPAPELISVLGGDTSSVRYTLYDMAADTVGLIAALGYDDAHVLGHSMGAGIAQLVATEYPERVRTLTLFAGSPVGGDTGAMSPRVIEVLMQATPADEAGRFERVMGAYRLCVEPEPIDEAPLEVYVRRQMVRAPNPDMQCLPATIAANFLGRQSTPTHEAKLCALPHPTLVLHGTGDLFVGYDGGEDLAALIPDATLVTLDGMGHAPIDPRRWSTMAAAVVDHVGR
jgi:pimeloyl-ACP methyl ester carboxylesterase